MSFAVRSQKRCDDVSNTSESHLLHTPAWSWPSFRHSLPKPPRTNKSTSRYTSVTSTVVVQKLLEMQLMDFPIPIPDSLHVHPNVCTTSHVARTRCQSVTVHSTQSPADCRSCHAPGLTGIHRYSHEKTDDHVHWTTCPLPAHRQIPVQPRHLCTCRPAARHVSLSLTLAPNAEPRLDCVNQGGHSRIRVPARLQLHTRGIALTTVLYATCRSHCADVLNVSWCNALANLVITRNRRNVRCIVRYSVRLPRQPGIHGCSLL